MKNRVRLVYSQEKAVASGADAIFLDPTLGVYLMNIARFSALLCTVFLVACGQEAATEARVPAAQPANENVMEVGDYEIHVNAISTDQVPPQVAQSYGIVRSQNRALLNVAVVQASSKKTIESTVTADAVNLTGQLKNISLRKIEEPGEDSTAIYYIGEVAVANRETLLFDVGVVLPGTTDIVRMKFKRQFFSD